MAHQQLILNRYRPIAEAGAGGFGTVQVAWDTRIQRKEMCIRDSYQVHIIAKSPNFNYGSAASRINQTPDRLDLRAAISQFAFNDHIEPPPFIRRESKMMFSA